eukprot:580103-Hanusia_phi.AAC.4
MGLGQAPPGITLAAAPLHICFSCFLHLHPALLTCSPLVLIVLASPPSTGLRHCHPDRPGTEWIQVLFPLHRIHGIAARWPLLSPLSIGLSSPSPSPALFHHLCPQHSRWRCPPHSSLRRHLRLPRRQEGSFSSLPPPPLIPDLLPQNKDGKLRLLYEAAPMSFLMEQAGGLSLTGKTRIMVCLTSSWSSLPPSSSSSPPPFPLIPPFVVFPSCNDLTNSQQDLVPQKVHQRVPFLAGSYDDVMEMRSYYDACEDPEIIKRCLARLEGSAK